MRLSDSHKSRRWYLALGLVGVTLLCGQGAGAQKGGQSDVSGLSMTTSDVVAGAFGPPVGSVVHVLTFVSTQVARNFREATTRISAQLNSQSFTEQGGARAPAATQNLMYDVMSGGSASNAAAARLVQILTASNADPQTVANAQALADALLGLLPRGMAVDSRYFNTLAASQLNNATGAYNAFIDSSRESFLAGPPPEVGVIRVILMQLTGR
jgi:hypothetical protein